MTIRDFDFDVSEIEDKIPSVLVSADSHVDEPPEAWDGLPARLRAQLPEATSSVAKRPPGGRDPKARIADMDLDGVTAEVLYPTRALAFFGMEREFQEAAFPLYNDWLADYCRTAPKRLFGIPCLPTYDIDAAIAEMHRCLDMGLVGALIWQVPDPKIPFLSDHYEKLWAAAAEAGAPVNLHILTGHNYSRDRTRRGIEQIRGSVNHKTSDAMNTVYDMIWSGLFARHPRLKIVLVEAEIGWLPFVLQQWDYYLRRFTSPGPLKQEFPITQLPSEIFRDHMFCTFMDDYVGARALEYWGQRNCMWSSDYPHGNMTWPKSRHFIARQIGDLPMDVQKRLVCDNVVGLYGLEI